MKKNKRFFVFSTLVFSLLSYQFFIYSKVNNDSDDIHDNNRLNNYNIYALNLPKEINFCGEIAPLDDIDVKERFDKELLVNTYYQSQTILLIKRANRWFPIIEEILEEEGVPQDLKYIAIIESGLTNVTSPAGAKGFWQFMKSTAISYGLEVNEEVDERYHLEKATRAAAQYLKKAKEKFGTWTLAAASYNRGIPGINRDLNRQKVNNYYDLLLNNETARYVFRILAVKEIIENHENYGFHVRKKDMYPIYNTKEITVQSGISNFADFALKNQINYKILKTFNPWLRQGYLTNSNHKTYQIKIPTEGFKVFSHLDTIIASKDSLKIDSLVNE